MKIIFKKADLNDVSFLNEVRNNYVKEFLHDSTMYTLAQAREWFKEKKPDYYIILLNKNKIGYFRTSAHSKKNKNIYIGADLHPDYIGKKLSFICYNKFIEFLFKKYELNKISLEVLETNQRAINLYKKVGFVTEGAKRQEVLKNDIFVDSIIMSILKQEWKR